MATKQRSPLVDFLKTFVVPALLIFLVPVIGYFFFWHAQSRYDAIMRAGAVQQIQAEQGLSPEEKAQQTALFSRVPFSRLLLVPEFAQSVPDRVRFEFATFRWMIRISAASIVSGVAVFVVAGLCVALSLHSPYIQYLSLLIGWHVLRIFGALQTVAQGILLFALSYWVTALWFERISVKLIALVGILAIVAVGLVIAAIFRRVKGDFVVEGQVLDKAQAGPLWDELQRICSRVGTAPPEQIIAGIDDNFFVTEHPVIVNDKPYRGRTLFISLSLLKQLQGGEADAVLAHEMAHFSGEDTLYSRKIGPLLNRYGTYLKALHDGGLTWPIYSYMLCFRALFQLSLGRLSRQREFRADQIALSVTSPREVAGALLRVVAYSQYRGNVETELFAQERAMESANVSERIERGFHQFAAGFMSGHATGNDIGELAQAHPFDSHPPLAERLAAIGLHLDSAEAQALLNSAGDGKWYHTIPSAAEMETTQWKMYEEHFRTMHEETLPYRFLPETEEEQVIVAKAFPALTFTSRKGDLSLDHSQFHYSAWPGPIRYADIMQLSLDNNVLTINYESSGKQKQTLAISTFAQQQTIINSIQTYYGRYLAAAEYQKQKKVKNAAT